jgi:hypothetical protein
MVANVIRQKAWTEPELRADGFQYYQRNKAVVMVRQLPRDTSPVHVKVDYETLLVQDNHVMCYGVGDTIQPNLDDYDHWPCELDIFKETYKPWDEPDWWPTPVESDLMSRGCMPYYKFTGVWAKKLTQPTYVQSLESPAPALIPPGQWLVIGAEGAPYHMNDAAFTSRYTLINNF